MNNSALVQLKNIRLSLGGKIIFPDLSWELLPGQHWAIIGANAQGKSSFLKLLAGELHLDQDAKGQAMGLRLWNLEQSGDHGHHDQHELEPGASFAVPGGDPSPLSARRYASLLSPALQARYQTLELILSGRELVESGFGDGLMFYDTLTSEQTAEVDRLASELGADSLLERQVSVLSQGQLRLLLLLRAMVKRPRLLLLDEPGDGLDANAFAILGKAVEMSIANGASVILATHNKDELLPGLTHFMEFKKGVIVSSGSLAELKQPGGAVSNVEAAREAGETGETRKDGAAEQTRRDLEANADLPAQNPLASLRNVDVFVEGEQILYGLDWKLNPGQNWVISGANGSGKSSFIRLLRGDLFPALGGELRWLALEPEFRQRPTLTEIQQKFALVSDRLQAEYDYDLSGLELILSGLDASIGLYREFSEAERAEALHWAGVLRLEPFLEQPISRLSSGTLRRFFLARALLSKPLLLLLDEPCSGLDQASRRLFMDTLAEVLESGKQALYISHRPSELTARLRVLFTHAMKFKNGRMRVTA